MGVQQIQLHIVDGLSQEPGMVYTTPCQVHGSGHLLCEAVSAVYPHHLLVSYLLRGHRWREWSNLWLSFTSGGDCSVPLPHLLPAMTCMLCGR